MVLNWRHYFIAMSVLAVMVSGGIACAVKMDATVGFAGLAGAQVWTPVNVTLENDSGGDFTGTLEATEQGYGGPASANQVVSCSPHVNLPPGSKKQYQIYVKLREYNTTIITLRSGYWIAAQVKPRVDLTAGPGAGMGDSDYSVVTVGGQEKRLSFLSGGVMTFVIPAPMSGMPAMGGGGGMPPMGAGGGPGMSRMPPPAPGNIKVPIKIGWIDQQNLPDRPAGFASVDMLVLMDFSVSAVSPEILSAIKMWVAGGGTLVIPSGADYRKLQDTSFYGELLPVTVIGAGQAAGMPKLETACKSASVGTIALTRATPISGKCNYSEKEASGLIWGARNYGAGQVIFLAFDPSAQPFRNWAGQTAFWKHLIDKSQTQRTSPVMNSFTDGSYMYFRYSGPSIALSPDAAVSMNPAVDTPSPSIIWVFLCVYIIVLVPVNYTILRMKKRLELAWLTVPAIVTFFTIGAYGIGYSVKGGQILLSQASIMVTSAGSRMACTKSSGWVFSPARRGYKIELNDPMALGNATHSGAGSYGGYPGSSPSPFPYAALGEKIVWENVKMAMWSSQSFESRSGLDLGGAVNGQISVIGTTLTGTVTNNTGYDLVNCLLVHGTFSKKLDDLPRGKSLNVGMSIPASSLPKGGIVTPPPMPGMGGGVRVMPVRPGPPGTFPGSQQQPVNQVASRLRSHIEATVQGSNECLLIADINVKPGYSIADVSPKEQSASSIIVRF